MYMLGSEGTEIKATLNFKVALNLVGSSWIIPQLGYGGKGYNRWLYEVLRECRRKTANEETWKNYALFLTKRYHNPKVFKVSSSDSFQRVSKVKTIFIIIMVLFFFYFSRGYLPCNDMVWWNMSIYKRCTSFSGPKWYYKITDKWRIHSNGRIDQWILV